MDPRVIVASMGSRDRKGGEERKASGVFLVSLGSRVSKDPMEFPVLLGRWAPWVPEDLKGCRAKRVKEAPLARAFQVPEEFQVSKEKEEIQVRWVPMVQREIREIQE